MKWLLAMVLLALGTLYLNFNLREESSSPSALDIVSEKAPSKDEETISSDEDDIDELPNLDSKNLPRGYGEPFNIGEDIEGEEFELFETTPEVTATKTPEQRKIEQIKEEEDSTDTATPQNEIISALQDLGKNTPSNRRFNPGVRVSRGNGIARGGSVNDAVPRSSIDEGPPILFGQPRGYVALQLMHPRARDSVDKLILNLIDARIQEPYLGVLVDGTFESDFEYLETVVRTIGGAGRDLYLALYLTNGATMRSYMTTPINTFFSRINPEIFRSSILSDAAMQAEYRRILDRVKGIVETNLEQTEFTENAAVIMLEDNLDAAAYKFMRDEAERILGEAVEYVRNPCIGCFEGNDSHSFGDPIEVHTVPEFEVLEAFDAFTFDGIGYSYPNEAASPSLNFEETKALMLEAYRKELLYVGLWRGDRQGLGSTSVHPNDRFYAVPSEEELASDRILLREGLEPFVE